jgi:hypothetical protein
MDDKDIYLMLTITVFTDSLKGAYVLFEGIGDIISPVNKRGIFNAVQKVPDEIDKSIFIEGIFKDLLDGILRLLLIHASVPHNFY